MLPHLRVIRQTLEERQRLEATAKAIYGDISASLIDSLGPISRLYFNDKLAGYTTVIASIEEQEDRQADALAELQVSASVYHWQGHVALTSCPGIRRFGEIDAEHAARA